MARKLAERQIVIASHNQGKIREIKALFQPLDIQTLSAAELKLAVPDENGHTYLENALLKARACVAATAMVSLGDDSGVEVEGLNGAPGLYTAPYTDEQGGLEKVFLLWQNTPAVFDNPKAAFMCCQVMAWPDGHYEYHCERVQGRLVFPPRGSGGHGYDPIFIPEGHNKTMAEMTFAEKQACSHRFLALRGLIEKLI